MKAFLFILIACYVSTASGSPTFTALQLSADGKHLAITTSEGQQLQAPALQDQVGFQSPKVSPNGAYVGWLALFPNCCTSYPIPLTLVVMDASQKMQSFDGVKLATFKWCFLADSASVALMQTQVHGTNYEYFEQRALQDGRLIDKYEFAHEEDENTEARKRAPAWVKCPVY